MTNASLLDTYDDFALYRYLTHQQHAADFLEGKVRLSTLKWIQECDSARADSMDGRHIYRNVAFNDSQLTPESNIDRNLKSIGFQIHKGASVSTYGNVTFLREVQNCFVLCLSRSPPNEKLVRIFGKYCIRIEHGRALFNAIWVGLDKVVPTTYVDMAELDYQPRDRSLHDQPVSPIFTGAPGNQYEQEVRMAWQTPLSQTQSLIPLVIDCPMVPHCGLTLLQS